MKNEYTLSRKELTEELEKFNKQKLRKRKKSGVWTDLEERFAKASRGLGNLISKIKDIENIPYEELKHIYGNLLTEKRRIFKNNENYWFGTVYNPDFQQYKISVVSISNKIKNELLRRGVLEE